MPYRNPRKDASRGARAAQFLLGLVLGGPAVGAAAFGITMAVDHQEYAIVAGILVAPIAAGLAGLILSVIPRTRLFGLGVLLAPFLAALVAFGACTLAR